MGMLKYDSSKLSLYVRGPDPQLVCGSLGLRESTPQTTSRSVQPFLHSPTTGIQTDRTTTVTTDRFLCCRSDAVYLLIAHLSTFKKLFFLSVWLKIRTIRACEVTTLWGYTNMFIIVVVVIIILFILLLFFNFNYFIPQVVLLLVFTPGSKDPGG